MNEQQAAALRQNMVLEIAAQTVLAGERIGKYNLDARVMDAMGKVPRHEFVPVEMQPYAYLNRPLPIGFDKTISQPFIVAVMTDMLEIRKEDVVLEIGTGLGYQAAVLAELAHKVYSVEIIEALAQQAAKRLGRAGYTNVEIKVANGSRGLPEHAPFDKVMVTAAPDLIPPALINQLKPGGRMMIPAGLSDDQQLILVEKNENGRLATREILPVRFSQLEGAESI
jgi:protein-L-isoaspartate(D-aspartate) O-methyltransferase